eukprot:gene19395-25266_t
MYTTKSLHKNKLDNNAYITIGDPYKDPKINPFREGQVKKGKDKDKDDKKPFHIEKIPNNAEKGNFSKLTYQSAGYQENIAYLSKQPLNTRKNGFGTRDAHKRDEFTSTIRTEQYRETLRKEIAMSSKRSKDIEEELQRLLNENSKLNNTWSTNTSSDSADFSYNSQVMLYDIGRKRITPFDPKSAKDTFYKFKSDREKRFGNTKPASSDIGESSWDINYKPPAFGGKSEVKNFYDRSHLTVNTL